MISGLSDMAQGIRDHISKGLGDVIAGYFHILKNFTVLFLKYNA